MSKKVVGIRFRKAGRMYYFNPGELPIQDTDGVIVETAHGTEYGDVVLTPRELPEEQLVAPLKDVLRVATPEDREIHERNLELEQEAMGICQEKIKQHALDMKLVDVEYSFNGSKITFFFTSEGRVDFRDLVKDLAFVFKTRIELRQIGVRDEAKMLGGLGSCGRPICCKTFLTDFQPVSIKMAKEQKLSLSPTKISGLCGRLMCCLKYEQGAYESMRKLMPKLNREVITPDGKGMVLDNNAITERTKVRITLPDGTPEVRSFHFSEVRKPSEQGEDEAIRKELQAISKARTESESPKEDEFRFVTGAAREEIDPAAPADTHKPRTEQRRRPPRRRPPAPNDASAQQNKGPARGNAQKNKPASQAANKDGAQKPSGGHRGDRNRRPKPASQAPKP